MKCKTIGSVKVKSPVFDLLYQATGDIDTAYKAYLRFKAGESELFKDSKVTDDSHKDLLIKGPFAINTTTGEYKVLYEPSEEEKAKLLDEVKDDKTIPKGIIDSLSKKDKTLKTNPLSVVEQRLLKTYGRINTADGVKYSPEIEKVVKEYVDRAINPTVGDEFNDGLIKYKITDVTDDLVTVNVFAGYNQQTETLAFTRDDSDTSWKYHMDLAQSRAIDSAVALNADPLALTELAQMLPRALGTTSDKLTPMLLLSNSETLSQKVSEILEHKLSSSMREDLGIEFKLKRFDTSFTKNLKKLSDKDIIDLSKASVQELKETERAVQNAMFILNKKRVIYKKDEKAEDREKGYVTSDREIKETLKSMHRTLRKIVPLSQDDFNKLSIEEKNKVSKTMSIGIITLVNQMSIDLASLPTHDPSALQSRHIQRILAMKEVVDLVAPLNSFISNYGGSDNAIVKHASSYIAAMQMELSKVIMHQTIRILNETKSVRDRSGNISTVSESGNANTVSIKDVNKEIQFLEANFRDTSSINHPFLSAMRSKLDDMFYDIQQTFLSKVHKYSDAFKKFTDKYGKDGYSNFFELDEKGKKTGKYVREFKPEFYTHRYELTRGTISFNDAKTLFANVNIDPSAAKQKYDEARLKQIEKIKNMYAPELLGDEIRKWDKKNTPANALDLLNKLKSACERNDQEGFEKLIGSIPIIEGKAFIRKDNVITPKGDHYKSTQYAKIKGNSDLSSMYDTLLEISEDAVSQLGGLKMKNGENITKYHIARVAHNSQEKFLKEGLLAGMKNFPSTIKNMFLATATSSIETDVTNAKGQKVYSIPAFGYSNDVAIEDMSDDLGNTAMLGLLGAINHTAKGTYQPYLESIRDYILNNPSTKVAPDGTTVTSLDTTTIEGEGDKQKLKGMLSGQERIEGNRTAALLVHTLEKLLYEVDTDNFESQSKDAISKKVSSNDPELIRRREEAKNEHEKLKGDVERGHMVRMNSLNLQIKDLEATVKELENRIALEKSVGNKTGSLEGRLRKAQAKILDIENKKSDAEVDYGIHLDRLQRMYLAEMSVLDQKVFSMRKAADASVGISRLVAIGWSVQSAFFNFLQGMSSNWVHATGKEDYSTGHLLRATAAIFSTMGNNENSKKYDAVVSMFDLDDDLFRAKAKGVDKIAVKQSWIMRNLNPFRMTSMVEKVNQGSNTIAILMGTKFTNTSGKEVSVWDAIKPNETGTMFELEGMEKDKQEEFLRNLNKRIMQVKKITQGNYNEKDPLLMNKSWFSKMITMFKRFVGESYATRFEKQRYDARLDRVVKGRYRSLYDGVASALKASKYAAAVKILAMHVPVIGRFVSLSESTRNELGISDTDVANYRKNVAEFEFFTMCALAKISLKDDKERKRKKKKKSFMENLFYNMFDRFQEDWGIGLFPSQLLRIGTVNIMPFAYAKKVAAFVESLLFNWGEDRYYKTGPHAKENITLRRFLQIFPFLAPMVGARNLGEQHVERSR